jgi:hypothetical protein
MGTRGLTVMMIRRRRYAALLLVLADMVSACCKLNLVSWFTNLVYKQIALTCFCVVQTVEAQQLELLSSAVLYLNRSRTASFMLLVSHRRKFTKALAKCDLLAMC